MNYENIFYDDFNLIVGDKYSETETFDEWEKVETFVSSDKYDKHYMLNASDGRVIFGNHISGKIPPKGKNNILFSSLAFTYGRKSNINNGMIKSVKSKNPIINNIKIEQLTNAIGGRDMELIEDMQRRAARVLESGESAVVLEDYERIVKKTPGLIIGNIKILPAYSEKATEDASRCVTIVIEQKNKKNNLPLKSYEENIKRYLDKFRLINTKILVAATSCIRLNISGEIIVSAHYRDDNDFIKSKIQKYIEKLNMHWGEPLYFGELFGMIDRLPGVSCVKNLMVVPKGDYIEQTSSSDVIIKPNGVYYLEKVNLIYEKSTNI